jgi:hypothetical protein
MRRFEDLAFLNGSGGLVDTSWGPVKIGVYARHLERWLRCFPLKQLLFVSGERLIVDPAAEMARVQVSITEECLRIEQTVEKVHIVDELYLMLSSPVSVIASFLHLIFVRMVSHTL